MQQATVYAAPKSQSDTGKVLSITTAKRAAIANQLKPNSSVRELKHFEVRLTRDELPLTVQYDDKTYILVLTKSNKLLLQKPLT